MPNSYSVPAIDRAMRLLDILAHAPHGMTLAELSVQMAVPKSTLFRILQTLQEARVVAQDTETRTFKLGMRLLEWGYAALQRVDLKTISHSHLIRLSQEKKESFYLAILDSDEVILIDHVDTPEVWKMVTRLGYRSPVHCTATGLVLIADLEDKSLEQIINRKGLKKYTSRTITDVGKLKRRLKEVRKKGYSVVNGEYKPDLLAIAVPIRDHLGKVIAALMTAVPSVRANHNKNLIDSLLDALLREGDAISREIGFRDELVL